MASINMRSTLCMVSPAEPVLLTLGRPVLRVATLMMISVTAASLLSADDLPEECKKYASIRIPPGDQPTATQIKALVDCDSEDLYYGLSRPPEYVRARLCAYAEPKQAWSGAIVIRGPKILMMIYANGKGVARNFELAMRFACEDSGFAKIQLPRLEDLKANKWKDVDFDYCDNNPGFDELWDFCREREERRDDEKRENQMDAIISKWSAADKQAFAEVQLVEDKYSDAMQSEVDYHDRWSQDDLRVKRAEMKDFTLSVLSRLETGKFPGSRNANFAKADAELNAVYKETMRKLKKGEADGTIGTAIRADGVRDTERVWLKYLTAWIAFVQYKYPLAPADSVRTWLTQARTKHLNELMIH